MTGTGYQCHQGELVKLSMLSGWDVNLGYYLLLPKFIGPSAISVKIYLSEIGLVVLPVAGAYNCAKVLFGDKLVYIDRRAIGPI